MLLLSILLILSGALLGTGITLAITRRRTDRIQHDTWRAANIYYTRQK